MAVSYIPCSFPYFPIPYGCWCGISVPFPPKHEPIDNFDEKCKVHDYCYEDAYPQVIWQTIDKRVICKTIEVKFWIRYKVGNMFLSSIIQGVPTSFG